MRQWWSRYLAEKVTAALKKGVAPDQITSVFNKKLLELKEPYLACAADAIKKLKLKEAVLRKSWLAIKPAVDDPPTYCSKALESWDALWGGNNAAPLPHESSGPLGLEECDDDSDGEEVLGEDDVFFDATNHVNAEVMTGLAHLTDMKKKIPLM